MTIRIKCAMLCLLATGATTAAELTHETIGRIHAASIATKWSTSLSSWEALNKHRDALLQEMGADWTEWLDRAQGIAVGFADGRAIVALPGTADQVQQRIQRDGRPANILNGNTTGHRGFGITASAVTPELLEMLTNKRVTDIVFTGFSAGAATSVYTAFNMLTSEDPFATAITTASIITFGGPRASTPRIKRAIRKVASQKTFTMFEILTTHPDGKIDPVSHGWTDMLQRRNQPKIARFITGLGHPILLEVAASSTLHDFAGYLAGIERLKQSGPQPPKRRHLIRLND